MTTKETIDMMEKNADMTLSKIVIEAHNMAIKALEKQIPKKPVHIGGDGIRYTSLYRCPNCGQGFSGTGIADYCYHCGQKLDWESEENNNDGQ